jgi:hypothetical protein
MMGARRYLGNHAAERCMDRGLACNAFGEDRSTIAHESYCALIAA